MDSTVSDTAPTAPAPPTVHVERWIVVLGAAVVISSTLGAALSPYLIVHYPLLLIALSPLPRHLVAVAPLTTLQAFIAVALLRRMFTNGLAYAIGRKHGVVGLHWLAARFGQASQLLNTVITVFDRAAPLFLFLAPGPLFCALAGVRAMPVWIAATAAILGQAGWLYLTYLLGDVLAPWVTPVIEFVRAHVMETTVACVLLVGGYQLIKRARKP